MADAEAPFSTSRLSMSLGLRSAMRLTPLSWLVLFDVFRFAEVIALSTDDLSALITEPPDNEGCGPVRYKQDKRAAVTRRRPELSSLNLDSRAGNRLSACLVRHSTVDTALGDRGRREEHEQKDELEERLGSRHKLLLA